MSTRRMIRHRKYTNTSNLLHHQHQHTLLGGKLNKLFFRLRTLLPKLIIFPQHLFIKCHVTRPIWNLVNYSIKGRTCIDGWVVSLWEPKPPSRRTLNKVFNLTEEQIAEGRTQANLQIITKINCEFKLKKEKATEIVQQIWQLDYEPECTLIFRGKENNIFVFLLNSKSDVQYALSKNLWSIGPFLLVVQECLYGVAPASINMDILTMWARLIDLPPELSVGEIPYDTASSMATCLMVEKPSRSKLTLSCPRVLGD